LKRLNHVGVSALGWRPEFLQALERDFRLILPDHRGTGDSDKPETPYSLADMARDSLAVIDSVGVSQSHVLGLSMGGAIAQEMTIQRPERIAALVL